MCVFVVFHSLLQELEVGAKLDAQKFLTGQVFRNHASTKTIPNPMLAAKVKSPAAQSFKVHGDASNLASERKEVVKAPRYDPDAPGALVLSRKGVVPVVVDPHLSKQLRPHQRDGIQFMYDCLMGERAFDGNGCILADEMGLGKTLQAVTLVWTMLKTGPDAEPLARKVKIHSFLACLMVVFCFSFVLRWPW